VNGFAGADEICGLFPNGKHWGSPFEPGDKECENGGGA
jgi:hypothetical protein